jgi:hypothetical protein
MAEDRTNDAGRTIEQMQAWMNEVIRQRDALQNRVSDLSDQIVRLTGIVGGQWEEGTAAELRAIVDRVQAQVGTIAQVRAVHRKFWGQAIASTARTAAGSALVQCVNELGQAIATAYPQIVELPEPDLAVAASPGVLDPQNINRVIHPEGAAATIQDLTLENERLKAKFQGYRSRDEERRHLLRHLLGVIADAAAELQRWHPRTERAALLWDRLIAPLRAAGWEQGPTTWKPSPLAEADLARVMDRATPVEQDPVRVLAEVLGREDPGGLKGTIKTLEEMVRQRDAERDALKAEVEELKGHCRDLRRVNADDRRDLDEWQKLAVKRRKAINVAIAKLRHVVGEVVTPAMEARAILEAVSETGIETEKTHAELEKERDELRHLTENLSREKQELHRELGVRGTQLDACRAEVVKTNGVFEVQAAEEDDLATENGDMADALRRIREAATEILGMPGVGDNSLALDKVQAIYDYAANPEGVSYNAARVEGLEAEISALTEKLTELDRAYDEQKTAIKDAEGLRQQLGKVADDRDQHRVRYSELLSAVADVYRRIGPAAMPQWIRDQLEAIMNTQGRRGQLLEFADKAVLAECEQLRAKLAEYEGQVKLHIEARNGAINRSGHHQQRVTELEGRVEFLEAGKTGLKQAVEIYRGEAVAWWSMLREAGALVAGPEGATSIQHGLRHKLLIVLNRRPRDVQSYVPAADHQKALDELTARVKDAEAEVLNWRKASCEVLRENERLREQVAELEGWQKQSTEESTRRVQADHETLHRHRADMKQAEGERDDARRLYLKEQERADRLSRENDDLCGRVKNLGQVIASARIKIEMLRTAGWIRPEDLVALLGILRGEGTVPPSPPS